jgi:hypothetical protein
LSTARTTAFAGTVAAIALAVLILLATLWTASAAAASAGGVASVTRPAGAARAVRYFIVPPARNGHVETLREIAAETLGSRSRYREIFSLNKGRLQPGGGRLETPRVLGAGWILELPADARGPGVHFGRLPDPVAGAAAAARPGPAAGNRQPFTGTSLGGPAAAMATGVAVAAIALWLSRRRGRRGRRRSPADAREWRTAGPDLSWLDDLAEPGWSGYEAAPVLTADHPSAPMPRLQSDGPQRTTALESGPWRGDLRVLRDVGPTVQPDASQVAHRVLAEASDRAARITQRAQDDAAELLAAVQEEGRTIRQRAAELAAAIRSAAETDTGEIRTAITAVSADLSQLAAHLAASSGTTAERAVMPLRPQEEEEEEEVSSQ